MSGYNVSHVIEECVVEKSRNLAPGVKRDQYDETWAALNTWLLKRMKQQKGGEVGFLGSFAWEVQKQDDGSVSTRPIFLIADSFVKDFNVKRQRVHYKPKTTKVEIVNYSQLAIKFTNSLTKDMVFGGTRDIMRKIGSFCARGATLDVQFSFGTLRIKENKVKFDFDPSALGDARADGDDLTSALKELEAEMAAEEAGEEVAEAKEGKGVDDRGDDSGDKPGGRPAIPGLALPLDSGRKEEEARPSASAEEKQEVMSEYEEGLDEEYFDEYTPEGLPMGATLHDMLMNMGPVSPNTRKQRTEAAREVVANEAFARCLTVAEQQARAEELTHEFTLKQLQDWRAVELAKKEREHSEMLESQRILDGQMCDYENKMEAGKSFRRDAKINYKLPGTVPDHLLVHGPPKTKKEMQKELMDTLGYMIRTNEHKTVHDREERIKEEKEYLDHVAMEIDLTAALERAEHLEQQKLLLDAWEKDGHIRNIQKLRDAGKTQALSGYIDENFEMPTRQTTMRGGKSKGFAGASVGFDTRK